MTTRNAEICAYYNEGHKLAECASRFKLGRQRILQILQASGAWRPYVKTDRVKFLGVTVSDETKAALKDLADEKGVSVSRLTSDILDEAVR
jgi:hypothetical protein